MKTDREQRPECTPSTSPDHDGEKADHGPETPTDGSSGSLKYDQLPEGAASTSSQQGDKEVIGSKGAAVTNTTNETTEFQTGLSDTGQSAISPSEGQGEPNTSEEHRAGNALKETTAPGPSTRNLTTDGNPGETVRGPAVLERSDISQTSELQDTDSAGRNTMPKSSDDHQIAPDDQQSQMGQGSVTEERNTSKIGEHPEPTVCTMTTVTEPQQKAPVKENLLGSSPTLEDNKDLAQVSYILTSNFSPFEVPSTKVTKQ